MLMPRPLTVREAATRLGVKRETLYAYVSRGVLSRTIGADGRTSRFDPAEVNELARRGRPRKGVERVGEIDVSLATSITAVHPARLLFRGHDATLLARTSTFEAVSELLWTGALPSKVTWQHSNVATKMARTVARALPPAASPIDRYSAVSAAIGPLFPLRGDTRPAAVLTHARELIVALATSMDQRTERTERAALSPGTSIAQHLWRCLSPLPPTSARVALLDAALVLLSDHELATSTIAARVAASTRADPFSVVLAGLGAMNGPLHGKAALRVQQLLRDAEGSSAEAALARAVQSHPNLPGFGHPVYRGADPRAEHLLEVLAKVTPRRQRALVEDVLRAAAAAGAARPNVDFALAAMAHVMGMRMGSTEAIFALARISGLVAHALEEYGEEPLRFRARAIYIGP